ncbi:CBO0543 family protein [Paenibacillus sp.]|uniref:CBO0543 family protein n=1 Tax=Paenibacillus sp. TaxID=58172 RepID=UPI002D22A024|nr:CBO0543 family protein [Paenibacillus sp.]HZG55344.1 CBO0543 family protein [Paenibacillus sp.]
MTYPWYEYAIILFTIALGVAGGWWVVRNNWKRYLPLYAISSGVGIALCFLFVQARLYSFPHNPPTGWSPIPLLPMATFLPFTVVFNVRYSPSRWAWKIPYYWGVVHLAIVSEILLLEFTNIFRLERGWDLWDSYSLWWAYYLVFEWLGERIVPAKDRAPIPVEAFRYGRWAWIVFHAIVISTIFIFGMYAGKLLWDR